jgi:hypothetical protein
MKGAKRLLYPQAFLLIDGEMKVWMDRESKKHLKNNIIFSFYINW